jgi:predicted SnoaL-like aldol condensation-catalyzing enzyme
MTLPLKHRTTAIQKSIETGERGPLAHFDSRRYVQHNLALGDGLAPLLAFLDSLPRHTTRVTPLRAFQDGDISFAHLEYHLEPLGHVVGFEVHRWEDDRIVEHWDNLQPVAAAPNPSGRTMLDGPLEATDGHRTAANKRHVELFVRDVLIADHVTDVERFVALDYREHNPGRGDGTKQLRAALGADDAPRYDTLHRVLGDGSFCLAMSEGTDTTGPAAFYDLFRVENGLIAEHWDVVETIPPRAEWRNDNGKF